MKIFYQRKLDHIMKYESLSFQYSIKLICCGSNAFAQFTDILIGTKQNDIVDLLSNTT